MPPVMGAAAFLMAESVGVPYSVIVKAAIVPALLYFSGIYIVTDLEAKKRGLRGLDKATMPKLGRILKERGYLILPLIAIIYILSAGFTPSIAALIGIGVSVLGGYLKTIVDAAIAAGKGRSVKETVKKGTFMRPRQYIQALEGGARSVLGVALACATAGIIAGMITQTGIGLKMGAGLSRLAGDNLLLLLIFTMLASMGGAEPQMKGHIRNNLRIGNDKQKLLDTITVLLPFIGYPRTLTALNCLNEVAPEES